MRMCTGALSANSQANVYWCAMRKQSGECAQVRYEQTVRHDAYPTVELAATTRLPSDAMLIDRTAVPTCDASS